LGGEIVHKTDFQVMRPITTLLTGRRHIKKRKVREKRGMEQRARRRVQNGKLKNHAEVV